MYKMVLSIILFTLIIVVFFRAYIKVKIIDDEEYEKNETFYVELDEPILVRRGSGSYKFLIN